MREDSVLVRVNGLLGRLLNIMAIIGGFFMFFVVLMTIADVLLRSLFNYPIIGTLEISQLFTVALIWLGAAYTMRVGGHVRMEMLSDTLFIGRRRILYWVCVRMSLLLLLVLMNVAVYDGTAYSIATREFTEILALPVYPFKVLLLSGSIVFTLEIVTELFIDITSLCRFSNGRA